MVVEAEIFPAVLTCLKDNDEYVKKNVAMLIREVAKHTPEVLLNKIYLCCIIVLSICRKTCKSMCLVPKKFRTLV